MDARAPPPETKILDLQRRLRCRECNRARAPRAAYGAERSGMDDPTDVLAFRFREGRANMPIAIGLSNNGSLKSRTPKMRSALQRISLSIKWADQ